MLAAVLGIGLFGPVVAPELVKPGMTREQVEAILGEATVGFTSASTANLSTTQCYPNFRLSDAYTGGEVRTVIRHR